MAIPLCRKPRPRLISRGAAPPCLKLPLRQDRFSASQVPPRCITSRHLYIYYKTRTYVVVDTWLPHARRRQVPGSWGFFFVSLFSVSPFSVPSVFFPL